MKKQLFFNYATVSPVRKAAYEAVKEFWEEFYVVGPPHVLYKYDPYSEKLADEAAKLLNCHPSEITYTKNTTEAVIIASEVLPIERGDEILVLGEEYPANLLPWLKKRGDGINVISIPYLHGPEGAAMLQSSINSRTKVVAMSSAQYYDGYMADLKPIADAIHANGGYFVVDAVQSIGIRRMDLKETDIDILACGGQKFLQAGPGIGFMYINQKILPKLRDFKPGIRSVRSHTHSAYELKMGAERFQDGTQNLSGIVALHASLQEINRHGITNLEHANLHMLHSIKQIFLDYNIPFIDHGERQSNIVSIKVQHAPGLIEYLRKHEVYLKSIKDIARFSFTNTCSLKDVEEVAKHITQWRERMR